MKTSMKKAFLQQLGISMLLYAGGAEAHLECGHFDVQIQAGVDPIVWTSKQPFGIIASGINATMPLQSLAQARFSSLFKIPWIVGGQVGYAYDDCVRVYLEANYIQSRGKKNHSVTLTGLPTQTQLLFSFGKYRIFDMYAGARYYFDGCWCQQASFFIGAKIGFAHHFKTSLDLAVTQNNVLLTCTPHFANAYTSNTIISAGGNVGIDYQWCSCVSLVLTGEIVASCGPTSNNLNIAQLELGANPNVGLAAVTDIIPAFGATELRFPVTLGIRYTF